MNEVWERNKNAPNHEVMVGGGRGGSFEMRQLFFQQVTEHQTGSELARMLQAFCALGVIFGRFCIDVFINLSRKEWLESMTSCVSSERLQFDRRNDSTIVC